VYCPVILLPAAQAEERQCTLRLFSFRLYKLRRGSVLSGYSPSGCTSWEEVVSCPIILLPAVQTEERQCTVRLFSFRLYKLGRGGVICPKHFLSVCRTVNRQPYARKVLCPMGSPVC
jgi:hypothetical protein